MTAPALRPATGGVRGGPGQMRGGPTSASSKLTEYFHVAFTTPADPGAIIVTGAFTDGGRSAAPAPIASEPAP
jgi:hypothetical protein